MGVTEGGGAEVFGGSLNYGEGLQLLARRPGLVSEHARGEGSEQEVQAAISGADGSSAKDRRRGVCSRGVRRGGFFY